MFGTIGLAGVQPSPASVSNTNKQKTKATLADVANQKQGKKPTKTATGQPTTIIAVNGQIVEQSEWNSGKTAVIAYGRFNPPTRGHDMIIEMVDKLARVIGAKPMVFITAGSENDRNPLLFTEKAELMSSIYGDIIQSNISESINPSQGIDGLISKLSESYDNLIIVTGDDRAMKYAKYLYQYNGSPNANFTFNHAAVVTAGDARQFNEDVNEGIENLSATKARDAARNGNYTLFRSIISERIDEQQAIQLYDTIRYRHGLEQQLQQHGLNEERHILTPTERIHRARIFNMYRQKIEAKREIAVGRRQGNAVINKRAKKLALNMMRAKLAQGQNYASLPFASRAAIDQRLRGKQRALNNLARKMVPRVRATENSRLSRHINEQFQQVVENEFPSVVSISEQQLIEAINKMI